MYQLYTQGQGVFTPKKTLLLVVLGFDAVRRYLKEFLEGLAGGMLAKDGRGREMRNAWLTARGLVLNARVVVI